MPSMNNAAYEFGGCQCDDISGVGRRGLRGLLASAVMAKLGAVVVKLID